MNLAPDSVISFFAAIANGVEPLAHDSPDSGSGLLMSAFAGGASALAVATMLAIYFRSGYRSARDVVRHSVAAAAVLGLLAFVAYDARHAGFAYLGINPPKPEVEFEMRRPTATESALVDARIELRTDRNQTLA
jgi:hypothetical protein